MQLPLHHRALRSTQGGLTLWLGAAPLSILPIGAAILCTQSEPWLFMVALSLALFAGSKWLTWYHVGQLAPWWRSAGYLLAWPGMDAAEFLGASVATGRPARRHWALAACKTGLGALLVWAIARRMPASQLAGYVGLIGMLLLLHGGAFHLLALLWQAAGVSATPIMQAPHRATSVADFWGRRWNLAFHALVHRYVFRRAHRRLGPRAATLLCFVASGLVHDLVISVPARAGYGLPTLYFLVQGVALLVQRRSLRYTGIGTRVWTAVVVLSPVWMVFHPPFVMRVVVPLLDAMKAL